MSNNISLINTESVLGATPESFERIALEVFRYQYEYCDIYRQYCKALRVDVSQVNSLGKVPFLPISFFKTHTVITAKEIPSLVFESSGTTGESTSCHYIADPNVYERSLLDGFKQFYGDPADWVILALLPSYLERRNASLVYMAKTVMAHSNHAENGYYINEWQQLSDTIKACEQRGQKVLLLGVTFALLDFAAAYPMPLSYTTVMETGGMKGRRQEMTRAEVHSILKSAWQLDTVHSEYGMTELLSQGYSDGNGIFKCTNTMCVLVRDINDPFDVAASGSGVINVLDLANVYSCSFIATEDLGRVAGDGSFEVLGRMDHSILRGCSLMAV